jgi:hypothetical protein
MRYKNTRPASRWKDQFICLTSERVSKQIFDVAEEEGKL